MVRPRLRPHSPGLSSKATYITRSVYCGLVLLGILLVIFFFREVTDKNLTRPSSSTLSSPIASLELDLVHGSNVILNIGSNVDPIVPSLDGDPCTVVVAFEPIVHSKVPDHPGLHMVPAAVSDAAGWAAMKVHNVFGVSSSLASPVVKTRKGEKDEGKLYVVPVLDFYDVLSLLQKPPARNGLGLASGHYNIHFIKSDMQGFDFKAFSRIPPNLWHNEFAVPYLMTEAYLDGVVSYSEVKNDLCWDWLPYMKEAGYIYEGISAEAFGLDQIAKFKDYETLLKTCRKQGSRNSGHKQRYDYFEANTYWRHPSAPPITNITSVYSYPTHGPWGVGPKFGPAQYDACKGGNLSSLKM